MTVLLDSVTSKILVFAQTRVGHLVETFTAFVLLQLLFATLYTILYRLRPDRFAFNSDILRAQSDAIRIGVDQELRHLHNASAILDQAKADLEQGVQQTESRGMYSEVKLRSGHRLSYSSGGLPARPSGGVMFEFRIEDKDDSELFVGRRLVSAGDKLHLLFNFPGTNDSWRALLSYWAEDMTWNIERTSNRLSRLSTGEYRLWSYWDFLYFSIIVQTTVGFGDILPNSTSVRKVVSIQILAGYALLVVVLNVVMSG